MQSGMGKSTWCRTFDKKYCDDTEELDDYEVKVVYINKFYNKTESSILMSIQDALMLNEHGEKKIKMDNPRYLNKNAEDKKKELAELLEFYRNKMYEIGAWKKEKLLLVLDGMDALLSTVMMPPGMPVATVAIDGAENAALLAIQILAVTDESLAEKLNNKRVAGAEKVLAADANLASKYN